MRKLRAQKIVIDLPTEEGLVWVQAVLQFVVKDADYRTTQTIDRVGYTNRNINDFALQMTSIVDPVTSAKITASGAAAALLIKQMIIQWMQEDHGGTVNELGDLIIED